MAYIYKVAQHPGNPEGEQRVQLANEDLVRPFALGSSWTKLRLTIRYTCLMSKDDAVSYPVDSAQPSLFVGFCAGAKGYGHPHPDLVLGVVNRPDYALTFSSLYSGYFSVSAMSAVYRRGTEGGRFNFSPITTSAILSLTPVRLIMMVELTKPYDITDALTYSLRAHTVMTTAPYPWTDQPHANFLTACKQDPPLVAQYASHSGDFSSWGLTPAELNLLDSVCVSWNRSKPMIEISNVSLNRFL